MAAAGAIVGALIAVGGWIARRTRAPGRTAAALAALGAAPLIVYDALALFTGHRAASVPAHGAISAAIAVVGAPGRRLGRAGLRRAAGARRGRADARPKGGRPSIALFVLGAGCQLANRLVLPRLYHWFHLSLGGGDAHRLRAGGPVALARRARLARRAPGAWRRRWLASVSIVGLGRSQGLRYVAYERTTLTALALRALPAPGDAQTAAAAAGATPARPSFRRSPPVRAARRPTSCSSPSTRFDTITSAPTGTPATRPLTSTSWPPRGPAFHGSIPRRRTPRSPSPRC